MYITFLLSKGIETKYIIGSLVTVLVIGLVLFGVTRINRAQVAPLMLSLYESLSGNTAEVVETPFLDIAGLPQEDAIKKIYGLRVTVGTSENTYSPESRFELYQLFIMLGKVLMIKGA